MGYVEYRYGAAVVPVKSVGWLKPVLPSVLPIRLWPCEVKLRKTSGPFVAALFPAMIVGRNLSDEVYKTEGQEFSSVGNIRTVYYGAPRTWSFTITAKY